MSRSSFQQAFAAALQHQQAGRTAQAETLYRQILSHFPDHANSLHMLGVLRCAAGGFQEGAELLEHAVAAAPAQAIFHVNLGNALKAIGKSQAALEAFMRATALGPNLPEAHYNLANSLKEADRLDDAIVEYQRAIALKPALAEAHYNLANTLRACGRRDAAIVAYRQTLTLKPDRIGALNNLGSMLQDMSRPDEAIAAYHQALARAPNQSDVLNNLGNSLIDLGRPEEAIAAIKSALSLKPDFPQALSNLGNAYRGNSESALAIDAYRRAIPLLPKPGEALWNLSMTLLLTGDFAHGWQAYESRLDLPGTLPREFDQPRWDGSPLNGRRILLHPEQGIGDSIHFIRYAALVRSRGGSVIVQCHPLLCRLFENMVDIQQVVHQDDPLPQFDVQCPLISLPLVFQTTIDTIPATIPYIQPDPALAVHWRGRLSTTASSRVCDRLKVGLAWAGNPINRSDRLRSIALDALAPLAQVEGVEFFSLQKGPSAIAAKSAPAAMRIVDWSDQLQDFADTAALISALDLVICVDTAVAHLAGALGKPVWLLLPFAPDWRWMLNRSDSPWYPTMRLVRQTRPGRWAEPIRQIAGDLRNLNPGSAIRGQ